MLVEEADLTSLARIRNAALELFAERGVGGTSIRDIAAAAGVSPGLVQHHFKTKEAVRDAVNQYVLRIATSSFRDLGDATGMDWLETLNEQITAVIREHHLALLYVARSMVEGHEDALAIFDRFVEIADEHAKRMVDEGLLSKDVDLRWAVLQMLVLNLGVVLLEPAVNRHLPAPYFTEEQLQRYHQATVGLFFHGIFKPHQKEDSPAPDAT